MIRLRFWGSRGSIVSPGPETQRYGGNTSCIQVTAFEGTCPGASVDPQNPQLLLDAGTGLAVFQETLLGRARRGSGEIHLLLSHLHWDHLIGLPFFPPVFIKGNRVIFYGASEQNLKAGIARLFTSVYSPIKGTGNLAAEIEYKEIVREGMEIDRFLVRAVNTHHPSDTLAFRIQYGDISFVYCTDHEAGDPDIDQRLLDLVQGSQLWILDAQYNQEQAVAHKGWGHSSFQNAVELAMRSGVPMAVLFHHNPEHDDETLDRIGEEARKMASNRPTEILMARDGMVVELTGSEEGPKGRTDRIA